MVPRFARLLVIVLATACGGGHLQPVAPRPTDAADGAGADRSIAPLPDAAADAADTSPATCAEDTHAAARVPLDVFLLLDASSSMNEPAGARTKHQAVRAALTSFLGDARSAGLGVGLGFFPAVKPCEAHGDCPADGNLPGRCLIDAVSACITPGQDAIGEVCSGAGTMDTCPAGARCLGIGLCPNGLGRDPTSNRCVLGTSCPDGTVCRPPRFVCRPPRSDCSGARYEPAAVAFADLPAALPGLTAALGAREAVGGTPLPEALAGTLTMLRARQAAQPGHKQVLVIASDGVPDEICGGGAGVVAAVAAARTAPLALGTYAIGVFAGDTAAQGRALLDEVARAGGTGAPFVLEPNAGLGDSFLAALDAIRAAALPCDYLVPPDDSIAFDRVNVRARGAGRDELIGYVAGADKCTAEKGGWHYDSDPRTTRPRRISLCPSTCATWKSLPHAEVELRFGCKTHVID